MIHKMLDLSTQHIKMDTAVWIDDQLRVDNTFFNTLVIAHPKEAGWFIHVPFAPETINVDLIPSDLVYLFGVARGMDCQWICLDADAPMQQNIPIYEWN